MSIANQLERIASIVEQITPLGNKERGMRIEADEWNQLVTALRGILEIDRVQEVTAQQSLEEAFAPKVHEHLGQVALTWLDSDLQSRMAEGPGSLSTRVAVADMGRKIDSAAAEVARLSAIADEQQKRNDRSSVDELERSAKLRAFEQRFAGVEDLRALVTQLGAQVQGLSPAVEAVLELRKSLLDAAGAPIDVTAVVGRVGALEQLSANLNGVDGRPLRLLDIELQIKELQDLAGIDGGLLDARIGTVVDQRLAALLDGIDQRVRAVVDEEFKKNVDQLSQQFRNQLLELQKRLESELAAVNKQLESEIAQLSDRIAKLGG